MMNVGNEGSCIYFVKRVLCLANVMKASVVILFFMALIVGIEFCDDMYVDGCQGDFDDSGFVWWLAVFVFLISDEAESFIERSRDGDEWKAMCCCTAVGNDDSVDSHANEFPDCPCEQRPSRVGELESRTTSRVCEVLLAG